MELTKDGELLLCLLYKKYLDRRKSGTPKGDAKRFGSSEYIQETIIPEWSKEDTAETCKELDRAGALDIKYGDNIPYIINLTDAAIRYMEERFTRDIPHVVDYISKTFPIAYVALQKLNIL